MEEVKIERREERTSSEKQVVRRVRSAKRGEGTIAFLFIF